MAGFSFNSNDPDVFEAFYTELTNRINTIDILMESAGLEYIEEDEYAGVENSSGTASKYTEEEMYIVRTLIQMKDDIEVARRKLKE